MRRSARYFGYPFAEDEIRRRVSETVTQLAGNRRRKIRLTLGPDGDVEVEAIDVTPEPEPVPVLLTDVRVDPADELLYHKTDRRRLYREVRERARLRGFREVIFRNRRGEVTEGSFTNVFVRTGNSWLTPPVSSGLLPGIFREWLLESRDSTAERVLHVEDIAAAGSVWLCNSVRELKRARVTIE